MKHDNAFIPESVEETIDQLAYAPHQEPLSPNAQLVQGLQQHYQAQQSATQRMWTRLEHYVDTHEIAFEVEREGEIQTTDTKRTNPIAGTRTERIQPMKVESPSQIRPIRRKIVSRLALLAALLCTFLIVGSLLIVFQAARSGHKNTQLGTRQAASQALYVSKATSVEKLDPQTRKVAWSTALQVQSTDKQGAYSSPRVIGQTLYTIRSGQLFALNTGDGHILWHKPNMLLPFVDDGQLYSMLLFSPGNTLSETTPTLTSVLFPGTTLFTLNPTNGAVESTYQGPTGGWVSPTVVNGILYYATNTDIVAIRLANQQKLWQQPLTKNQDLEGIQIENGLVYAQIMDINTPTGTDGRIIAFDANKGNQLWSTPALQIRYMVMAGSALYIASINGELSAYDAQDGQELWQKPFDTVNILADAHTLYINYVAAHQEGATALAALNAANGTTIWHKNMPWLEGNSPLGIQNGILYTASDNGHSGSLDALNASDGSSRWHMPLNGDASTWQACFG